MKKTVFAIALVAAFASAQARVVTAQPVSPGVFMSDGEEIGYVSAITPDSNGQWVVTSSKMFIGLQKMMNGDGECSIENIKLVSIEEVPHESGHKLQVVHTKSEVHKSSCDASLTL